MKTFEPETDGFCPKCDNEFFVEAKTKDNMMLGITLQGDSNMVRDDREKQKRPAGQGNLGGLGPM